MGRYIILVQLLLAACGPVDWDTSHAGPGGDPSGGDSHGDAGAGADSRAPGSGCGDEFGPCPDADAQGPDADGGAPVECVPSNGRRSGLECSGSAPICFLSFLGLAYYWDPAVEGVLTMCARRSDYCDEPDTDLLCEGRGEVFDDDVIGVGCTDVCGCGRQFRILRSEHHISGTAAAGSNSPDGSGPARDPDDDHLCWTAIHLSGTGSVEDGQRSCAFPPGHLTVSVTFEGAWAGGGAWTQECRAEIEILP